MASCRLPPDDPWPTVYHCDASRLGSIWSAPVEGVTTVIGDPTNCEEWPGGGSQPPGGKWVRRMSVPSLLLHQ